MTSLWQLKRFEARISLFKSLDCPLALAAAGMNQRFTRYPPVINHNLGWCNCNNMKGLIRYWVNCNNVNGWNGSVSRGLQRHYNDVIVGAIASQIISLTIVYSIVYSDANQRKHQSSVSLAFVRGIHRSPVNSLHKWPVTREMFPFDDVILDMKRVIRSSALQTMIWKEWWNIKWIREKNGGISSELQNIKGMAEYSEKCDHMEIKIG